MVVHNLRTAETSYPPESTGYPEVIHLLRAGLYLLFHFFYDRLEFRIHAAGGGDAVARMHYRGMVPIAELCPYFGK